MALRIANITVFEDTYPLPRTESYCRASTEVRGHVVLSIADWTPAIYPTNP